MSNARISDHCYTAARLRRANRKPRAMSATVMTFSGPAANPSMPAVTNVELTACRDCGYIVCSKLGPCAPADLPDLGRDCITRSKLPPARDAKLAERVPPGWERLRTWLPRWEHVSGAIVWNPKQNDFRGVANSDGRCDAVYPSMHLAMCAALEIELDACEVEWCTKRGAIAFFKGNAITKCLPPDECAYEALCAHARITGAK